MSLVENKGSELVQKFVREGYADVSNIVNAAQTTIQKAKIIIRNIQVSGLCDKVFYFLEFMIENECHIKLSSTYFSFFSHKCFSCTLALYDCYRTSKSAVVLFKYIARTQNHLPSLSSDSV